MRLADLHIDESKKDVLDFLKRDIDISFHKRTFDDRKKEQFYSELSILLDSGLDLKSAIGLLRESQKSGKLNNQLQRIETAITLGKAMSEAMKEEKMIGDYEYYSLQIGEETGKTAIILKELGVYFKNKLQQKQITIKAISYPLVVGFTAILAIIFMLAFVVPLFAGIFQGMGQDLPFLTRVILNTSDWFSEYYAFLLLSLITSIIIFKLLKQKVWFRDYFSHTLLKIPLLRDFILKLHLSRLCNSMALLLSSGVNLVRALELNQKMISFYPIANGLVKAKDELLAGKLLNEALSAQKIFPLKMIALLKVGEEVNKLDEFFAKISNQYERELETQSSILGSVLEPVILVFLGAVVAFILIAMYLPLFDLNRLF